MIVCPITSEENMHAEFQSALEQSPDFLELRTDLLSLERLKEAVRFAERHRFGIVLTVKNLHLKTIQNFVLSFTSGGICYADLDYGELKDCILSKDSGILEKILGRFFDLRIKVIISHHIYEKDLHSCRVSDTCFPVGSASGMSDSVSNAVFVNHREMMDELDDFCLRIRSRFRLQNKTMIKYAGYVRSADEAKAFYLSVKEVLTKEKRDVIPVPMGEYGRKYRLMLHSVSPLSYAYLCVPNAPGQPSIREYRSFGGKEGRLEE